MKGRTAHGHGIHQSRPDVAGAFSECSGVALKVRKGRVPFEVRIPLPEREKIRRAEGAQTRFPGGVPFDFEGHSAGYGRTGRLGDLSWIQCSHKRGHALYLRPERLTALFGLLQNSKIF